MVAMVMGGGLFCFAGFTLWGCWALVIWVSTAWDRQGRFFLS